MTPVILVATVSPKPGLEQDVREAILALIPRVHAEPGCGKYALHAVSGRAGDLVLIERWDSGEELKAHGKGAPVAEFRSALEGKLAAPLEVMVCSAIPTGTDEQGAI